MFHGDPANRTEGHLTYKRLKGQTIAFLRFVIGQKTKFVQVHFTLEVEGLRAQINYHG